MKNLKLQYPGVLSFNYGNLNIPCAQSLNAKSNFHLVDGKLVARCTAVQNFRKFARVQAVHSVTRTSIFLAKLVLFNDLLHV